MMKALKERLSKPMNLSRNITKYTLGYCFIESFSSFVHDDVIAFNL